MDPVEILHEARYLGLYKQGHWEFARRPGSDTCVGILPITDDSQIILIEQFRIPLQKFVIEIPAGLVGDEPDYRGESLAATAGRELTEETGYRATHITPLIASPTSSGMTPEITHLFAATGLTRVHDGGGVAGEEITVHHVPLTQLTDFLAQQQLAGKLIDHKIYSALFLAQSLQLIEVMGKS